MTREEKIDEALNNLSREEMFDKIRDNVYGWDHDTLYEYAIEAVEANLSSLNDDELRGEYFEWFFSDFDGPEYNDDDGDITQPIPVAATESISEAQTADCTCSSHDLLWNGCSCGYSSK
jgi:hypothetical protein